MMRSRRISLPLVLLWALAHGVWMGAGWHAGTQFGAAPLQAANASASCSCAWRSGTTQTKTPQFTKALVTSAHACPVCELGIVAPEVPSTLHFATVAPLPPVRGFARFSSEVSAVSTVLPPSRAPPIA